MTDVSELKFKDMTVVQKLIFTGKLVVFLASFGFAFPTLTTDPAYDDLAKLRGRSAV